jgi:hypothetical protein
MMNRELNHTPSGKTIPPVPTEEQNGRTAAQAGGFVALSAYTLALRDPELFSSRFLTKPRLH